ncbi:MAG: hypothetical protein QF535_19355 [Anaerolineales bacterium]|nr:hypothetical protein [Anaerolineales bacterium]
MPLGFHKVALFGVAGVSTGDVVLLSSQTASDSASITFTGLMTSTYGEYIFKFYNCNPATDSQQFSFQVNATDGADFNDSAITSTYFRSTQNEAGNSWLLSYTADKDQAEGTAFQPLSVGTGSDTDESCAGELHIFNPSSTTYVKHFIAITNEAHSSIYTVNSNIAGYINDTTAIDDIQFKFASGNISSGTIKMWGVK